MREFLACAIKNPMLDPHSLAFFLARLEASSLSLTGVFSVRNYFPSFSFENFSSLPGTMSSEEQSTSGAQQLQADSPWKDVLQHLQEMRSDMSNMADRLDRVEAERSSATSTETRSVNPSTPEATFASSLSWADRMDEHDEMLVSLDAPSGLEEDNETEHESEVGGTKCFQTSQRTQSFLKQTFNHSLSNNSRRQLKEKFGVPNVPCTATPQLDKVLRSRVSASTKSKERELARLQALAMDAVGPLTYIVEDACKGSLTAKDNLEAVQTALKLLGNFATQCNRARRTTVLQNLNPRILDMADEVGLYQDAGLNLFGDGFCRKAKERDDEMKALSSLNASSGRDSRKAERPFFAQDRRRFGKQRFQQANRGKPRYTPYQQPPTARSSNPQKKL